MTEFPLTYVPLTPAGWPLPNALTVLVTSIAADLAAITAAQNEPLTVLAGLTRIRDLVPIIDGLMGKLGLATAAEVPLIVADINAARAEMLAVEDAIQHYWQSTIGVALDNIRAMPTAMACTQMDDLWARGNPASDLALLEHPTPGSFGGSPYYTFEQVFSRSVPGASLHFANELANVTTNAVLAQALTDLTAVTVLPYPPPPAAPLWQATPPFPRWTPSDVIISLM